MAYEPVGAAPARGLVPYAGPTLPVGKRFELRPSFRTEVVEPDDPAFRPVEEGAFAPRPLRLEPPYEVQEYSVRVFARSTGLLTAIASIRREYFSRAPAPDLPKGGWLVGRHVGTRFSITAKVHFRAVPFVY